MFNLSSLFSPSKRPTRYKWPQYQSLDDVPTTYENFLLDDEPAVVRKALIAGDIKTATRVYMRAETGVQTMIVMGMDEEGDAKDAVDAFYKRAPDNPVACVMRGQKVLRDAWGARGSGSARNTSQSQFRGFADILDDGRVIIDQMLKVARKDAVSYATAITYGMATSQPKGEVREIWERGCEANSHCWWLHSAFINCIEPKWGGSFAMVEEATGKIMRLHPGSHLLAIRAYVFWEKLIYAGMCDQEESVVYEDPQEQQLVIDAYRAMRPNANTLEGIWALNKFAYCFWKMGNDYWLLDALKFLQHRYCDGFWQYYRRFDDGPLALAEMELELRRQDDAGTLTRK